MLARGGWDAHARMCTVLYLLLPEKERPPAKKPIKPSERNAHVEARALVHIYIYTPSRTDAIAFAA